MPGTNVLVLVGLVLYLAASLLLWRLLLKEPPPMGSRRSRPRWPRRLAKAFARRLALRDRHPDLLAAKHSEAFVALMRFQARRAQEYYDRAMAALPVEDRRAQRPGLIMAAIYAALLAEIERDGFRVLAQRTSLTPLRKFWIAWKTWLAA